MTFRANISTDSMPAGGPPNEFLEPLSVVLVTGFMGIILPSGLMGSSCSASEISSHIQPGKDWRDIKSFYGKGIVAPYMVKVDPV